MSRTRSSRTPYSVWRWLGFLLREKAPSATRLHIAQAGAGSAGWMR